MVELQHLVSGDIITSHTSRVKFYSDSSLDVSCELQDDINTAEKLLETYEVEAISDIQFDSVSKCYFARVQWKGFDVLESQWEDLRIIYEDVPQAVILFLDSVSKTQRKHALAYLGL
jgi:hypothetical protein